MWSYMWKVFFFSLDVLSVSFSARMLTQICDALTVTKYTLHTFAWGLWILLTVMFGHHRWSLLLVSPPPLHILKGRNAFVWQWGGECMDKHGFSSSEPQKRSLICSELNFDLLVLTHLPWALQRWVYIFFYLVLGLCQLLDCCNLRSSKKVAIHSCHSFVQ